MLAKGSGRSSEDRAEGCVVVSEALPDRPPQRVPGVAGFGLVVEGPLPLNRRLECAGDFILLCCQTHTHLLSNHMSNMIT